MQNNVEHCLANRGSPRLRAQLTQVRRALQSLSSDDWQIREHTLLFLENVWRAFLYRRAIGIARRRHLLVVHLLQISCTWSSDNRYADELDQLERLLSRILRSYPKRVRGDARRRLALLEEIKRLNIESLQARRYSLAYDSQCKWQRLFAFANNKKLAEELLNSVIEVSNPVERALALRWICENRRILPLEVISTRKLLMALHPESFIQPSLDEKCFAVAALVTTMSLEQIQRDHELWSVVETFATQIIANDSDILNSKFYQDVKQHFSIETCS